MLMKKIMNIFLAGSIAVPVIIAEADVANAQKVLSRQNIVNGLKRLNTRKVSRRSTNSGQRRAPAQNKFRAPAQSKFRAPPPQAKRRAPAQSKFRAPPPQAKRRAPPTQQFRAPAPSGKVAVRRAPRPQNQRLRAPGVNNTGNLQRRAPPVARGRAPSRAPNVVVKRRAPQRSQDIVIQRRAPNRKPQRSSNQVVSNNKQLNDRAIRIEQQLNTQRQQIPFDNASVDLEILFEYDSARISPQSVRQLIILGEALQDVELSASRIMIAGHTDAAGSNAYNSNLSYLRAQSVSNFLTNYAGVSAGRLDIEGYGEDYLKYPDAPNSGQNRRVEIINLGG